MLDGLKALAYHRPKAWRWSRFRRHMFLLMASTLERKHTPSVLQPLRGTDVCCSPGRLDHFQYTLVSGFCFTFNGSKYLHTLNEADLT